jgi:hypothetical protein
MFMCLMEKAAVWGRFVCLFVCLFACLFACLLACLFSLCKCTDRFYMGLKLVFTTLDTGNRMVIFCTEYVLRFSSLSFTTGTARLNVHQFYVLPTQLYLCVLCASQNKQRLFPYTALKDWFL